MPKTSLIGIALALSFLLFSSPLLAEPSNAVSEAGEIAELEQRSQEAFESEKWSSVYVSNLKLHELRPGELQYLVNVVRACGMLDRKTTAYHFMLQIQQQGMSFNFNHVAETEQIRGTEAYEYINGMLVKAGQPSGIGMPVFTLQGSPANFSSIAWDPGRKKFLVGTMDKGGIFTVSDTGETQVLVEAINANGWWSVTGLAVDSARNRLWAVSTASPAFTEEGSQAGNRAGLLEFDLASMELLARFDVPGDGLKHDLGSVAVTDDGTVYVVNHAAPVIYRKAPDSSVLTAFFSSPELRQLSDIAVTEDNSRIFVSDVVKGVLVIDPVAEQAAFLSGPETMNMAGATGLEYRQGQLFVVQGEFTPPRVVRLDLDGVKGTIVEAVSPMAIALEEFNRPGVGAIRGEELFYFANTGQADAGGAIVVSTPLDSGSEVAPPDMSQFEEALRSRAQQKEE
ncbi:hypothetical protein ACFL07_08865 [Pseudomonadota bacterium]